MSTDGFKLKLSAILSADVAGYSRLMRDDKKTTIWALNAYKEMFIEMDLQWDLDELDKIAGDNG